MAGHNLGGLIALGVVGLGAALLLTATPARIAVEAAYYYEEGLQDAHLRSYAIGKLKSLQKAAQQAGDTALAHTIAGYVSALQRYHAPEAPPSSPAPTKTPTPSSPTTAAPTASCTSQLWGRGSTGICVKEIQAILNLYNGNGSRSGFGQLAVDGIFGPLTQSAVYAFQENNHLEVDGIVGPQTWGRLLHKAAWQYPGPAKPAAGSGGGHPPPYNPYQSILNQPGGLVK